MIRIDDVTDKVAGYIEKPDLELIHRAYVFAAQAHHGVMRRSGEPYISHPLSVAHVLAEMELDEACVAAGLLHDTVEDTDTDVDEIHDLFGEEVADIVDGVTKISLMQFSNRAEAQAENIRKMILAMAEDIRVIMVKLADRLHNMRTLEHMKPLKQRLVAQETMDIYAPLANRLGLHRIKIELEDLCLRYLKPDIYAQLNEEVVKHHTAGQDYIDEVIELLGAMMEKNGIQGRTFGRTKHLYSTYTKMQQQGLSLDEVYDLIAFRVVVGSLKDCYAVLGLVHSMWKPVPGRFKDYISTPKANMYQSLHTTVIGPDGERIEIQIRTEEMHRVAEYGVAAHWQYKEKGKGPGRKSQQTATRDAERYTWLKQIMDWQREFSDAREFMAQLRFDLFQEEVYVFTPAGDVKELPEGATPVDFAYAIHTEVGDHCAGAKVNGKLVPLPTPLKNGDRVEVITDKNRMPSRDWLKFVKTAKARTRVKQYIRTEERARAVALAKEMLEKEGRKRSINFQKCLKDGTIGKLATEFSCGTADELMAQVGYARYTPNKVFNKLAAMLEGERPEPPRPEPQAEAAPEAEKARTPASGDSIKLSGVDNVLVHFASCCNPLPGEPIVGYITRGRGVTVHRTDCVNIKNFEPERLLNITWEGQEDHPYPADIRIICANERGMLAKISTMLNEEGINIDSGHFASNVDGNSQLDFTVEVKDLNQLYNALAKVKSIRQVREAVRMS
ncbi:MAG: bifunctional (p)ppGpp synthetase/guanosine-3',5'-bis(diphosphate) 3'-pyrophosphohydrolase [Desulfovibrionaceae bacterium]